MACWNARNPFKCDTITHIQAQTFISNGFICGSHINKPHWQLSEAKYQMVNKSIEISIPTFPTDIFLQWNDAQALFVRINICNEYSWTEKCDGITPILGITVTIHSAIYQYHQGDAYIAAFLFMLSCAIFEPTDWNFNDDAIILDQKLLEKQLSHGFYTIEMWMWLGHFDSKFDLTFCTRIPHAWLEHRFSHWILNEIHKLKLIHYAYD